MNQTSQDAVFQEWLRVARGDWERLHLMLGANDGVSAGFYLQQTTEKYLKGYLLQQGWQLGKTHSLPQFIDAASTYESSLDRVRPFCERVSGYYMVDRYPDTGVDEPDAAQIREDLQAAEQLVRALFPSEQLS